MKFKKLIEQITNEFITDWNNRDMTKLETYLSNDITVSSPNIKLLYPDLEESKLHKKENVMRYWKKLNAENYFIMKLIVLNKTDKIINCEVEINSSETRLHAKFTMNEYGKFCEMEIEYF